jgi:hypothetical protein
MTRTVLFSGVDFPADMIGTFRNANLARALVQRRAGDK